MWRFVIGSLTLALFPASLFAAPAGPAASAAKGPAKAAASAAKADSATTPAAAAAATAASASPGSSTPAQQPDSSTPAQQLEADTDATTQPFKLASGVYAVFHTSEGDFLAQLFKHDTPKTVANFTGLATGQKHWKHPITLQESNQPLYNNTIVYKIVPDIVIQGGDPINKGTGGPEFTVDLETTPGLAFDKPGMLAMDSTAGKSNGSRWLVSLSPFPDWTGKYTIFGKVIKGLDVVGDISRQPTKRPSVPLEPTLVNSIEIVEVPEKQSATASFSEEQGKKVLTIEKGFASVEPRAAATSSGGNISTSTLTAATAATTASAVAASGAKDAKTSGPAHTKKPASGSKKK